jgi:hypothetical protein
VIGEFNPAEVKNLRRLMLDHRLDGLQAAELMRAYLLECGYGICPESALDAACRVGGAGCTLEAIQSELQRLALVM